MYDSFINISTILSQLLYLPTKFKYKLKSNYISMNIAYKIDYNVWILIKTNYIDNTILITICLPGTSDFHLYPLHITQR